MSAHWSMHPRVGAGVIDEWPALHEVAKTVLYHHERLDGTGYPTGLGGKAIPSPPGCCPSWTRTTP